LKEAGIEIERYNLSQQPGALMVSALVRRTLQAEGVACLPLVLLGGAIVCRGRYPTRRELADAIGLESSARRLHAPPPRRHSPAAFDSSSLAGLQVCHLAHHARRFSLHPSPMSAAGWILRRLKRGAEA
jgi:hypothetical protein